NATHSDQPQINVVVMERFYGGKAKWLSDLAERKLIDLQAIDISDPHLKLTEPFEFVIHAASIASPIFYRQHPIETIDANVLGLYKVLDYMLKEKSKVRGMLFFSS